MFKPMIIEMTNRGPDSAGVAIYRNPVKKAEVKFSLAHDDPAYDWKAIDAGLARDERPLCRDRGRVAAGARLCHLWDGFRP